MACESSWVNPTQTETWPDLQPSVTWSKHLTRTRTRPGPGPENLGCLLPSTRRLLWQTRTADGGSDSIPIWQHPMTASRLQETLATASSSLFHSLSPTRRDSSISNHLPRLTFDKHRRQRNRRALPSFLLLFFVSDSGLHSLHSAHARKSSLFLTRFLFPFSERRNCNFPFSFFCIFYFVINQTP